MLRVKIEVLQGRNLASRDSNGLSDPFALVFVGAEQVHKTKVVHKSLNPLWREESVTLGRYSAARDPLPLSVEVWDHDRLDVPEFMGRCTLPPVAAPRPWTTAWLRLDGRGVAGDGRVTGDVLVAVTAEPADVRCESWLWRRERKTVRTKQRYFVLFAPGLLVCYADSATANERKRFDLVARPPDVRFNDMRVFLAVGSAELALRGPRQCVAAWVAALRPLAASVAEIPATGRGRRGSLTPRQQQPKARFYGVALEELAARGEFGPQRKDVPKFFQMLLDEVARRGMQETGIFRLSGNGEEIKAAQARLEAGDLARFLRPDEPIHNVTGLLKLFIRSLPEPLLVPYSAFVQAISIPDIATSNEAIKKLMAQLPSLNTVILSAVFKLLHELAKNAAETKMDAANLGIVFGPGILWDLGLDALSMLRDTKAVTAVAEVLIVQSALFFPSALPPTPPPRQAGTPTQQWQHSAVPRKPSVMPENSRRRTLFMAAQPRVTCRFALDDRDSSAVQRRALELFKAYDADNSGFLDLDEFLAFFIDLIQIAKLEYFSASDILSLMQSLSEGEMKLTPAQFQQWWSDFHQSLLSDE